MFYIFSEFIMLLYTFLVIYFSQYKKCIIWRISFSNFSDVLSALTYARGVGSLWSICFGVNILIRVWLKTVATRAKYEGRRLPFCCLLNLKIFLTISTILFGFSFSRIYFLLIAFLKSINSSFKLFTNCSFLLWLVLINFFAKNDGFWYFK